MPLAGYRLRGGIPIGMSWSPKLHEDMDGRFGSWLVGIDAKNENPLLRIRHRDGFGSQLGDFVVERVLVVADRVRALRAGPAGVKGIGSRGGDAAGANSTQGTVLPFCELELRDTRGRLYTASFMGDSGLGCAFVIGLNVALNVCEKLRTKKIRSKLKKPGMAYAWHPKFSIV